MIPSGELQQLAAEHGTPLYVIDHAEVRRNYQAFREGLPRVQAYYAIKANPDPKILKTLYDAGASFDVASMPEFLLVHENIASLSDTERQKYIWDKIIYSNPIKDVATLRELDKYEPLVAYDNLEEVRKVAEHAPHAGLILRIKVPNTGSLVELSPKFGAAPAEAAALVSAGYDAGLVVEGISFHVGSQCTNFENYVQALSLASGVLREARQRGYEKMNLLDIGGGFPVPYDQSLEPFDELAKRINCEVARLFPPEIEILAEPGRFIVASAAVLVTEIIGKATRGGKLCYYVNDGIYHTYSGILFDHCKYRMKSFRDGDAQICSVFGPTCDALDTISLAEELPDLNLGELLYTENIGAYSHASSTHFNGFPPAKVVHVNA